MIRGLLFIALFIISILIQCSQQQQAVVLMENQPTNVSVKPLQFYYFDLQDVNFNDVIFLYL